MARIRSIKPEFFTSEQIVECSTNARLLFVALWVFGDDAGRHPLSLKRLKMEAFPGDSFSIDDIRDMLVELWANGLIGIYQTNEGHPFLYVTGWHHQKIDRPQPSRCPNPEACELVEYSTNARRTLDEFSTRIPRALDEHSSLIGRDRIGGERKGNILSGGPDELSNGHKRNTYSPDFLAFWNAYPRFRRTGKGAAYRAWQVALRNGADPGEILQAVTEYAQSPVGSGEFSKMPQTWLTGRCWEDDREAWQGGNAQRASKCPTDEDLANWNPITG